MTSFDLSMLVKIKNTLIENWYSFIKFNAKVLWMLAIVSSWLNDGWILIQIGLINRIIAVLIVANWLQRVLVYNYHDVSAVY